MASHELNSEQIIAALRPLVPLDVRLATSYDINMDRIILRVARAEKVVDLEITYFDTTLALNSFVEKQKDRLQEAVTAVSQ